MRLRARPVTRFLARQGSPIFPWHKGREYDITTISRGLSRSLFCETKTIGLPLNVVDSECFVYLRVVFSARNRATLERPPMPLVGL